MIRHLLLKELGHLANKRRQVIGEHFWREPPQENKSRTVIGLFRERNVCRFEAAAWGRGALRDSGPSGCEGDDVACG